MPSGRDRTVPVTRTTYSDRRSSRAVDHALDEPGVIADVEEREMLAVLAPPGDPSAHRHGASRVGSTQCAAVISTQTHKHFLTMTSSRSR